MNRRWHTLDHIEITDKADRTIDVVVRYYPKGWSQCYSKKATISQEYIKKAGREDAIFMTVYSMCTESYGKQWVKNQLWEEAKQCLEESFNIRG